MKFLKLINSSILQCTTLLFVVLYLLGVLNIYFSDKNNYCEMTYMFEYPQFVRVTIPDNKQYPQYALYAYSEGRLTEKARKMWFDGIPVLFLPGNSGSHMQGRSLASVALRMALSRGDEYHFDYFTVSYNEELSGLYGGVLQSQTDFAAACISRILSLYKNHKYTKSVPTSVIIIGHSMGGLIAKRLLSYPDTINSTTVALALAAPLQAPLINFDYIMNDYYKVIDWEWEMMLRTNEIRNNKMLLSFGNGPRDVLVPSALTFSNDSDINAMTTAIPGVWVSPDHVSIVWCKQLVLAINKFLFSIVDMKSKQLMYDKNLMLAKAKQYFQANRSMTLDPTIIRANITMIPDAFWYEDNRRIYQISRPEIDKTTYLMIRLVRFPQNRFVAIESVNVDDKDWILGCSANYAFANHRYCKQATSLAELGRWTGAAKDFGRRKLATINLHQVMATHPEWTHVVVKVSPTKKPIVLNVDVNDHASRQLTVNLPSIFSFGRATVAQETEAGSIYYELLLPGFELVHQAYLLYVEPRDNCRAARYQVSAEVHVPWADNHEYYHYFTHLKRSPMKLRLYNSNPNATMGLAATEHVKVTLLLDPQCTYSISISSSWYHSLAQLARNYTPVLLPYIAAIILLATRSNIQSVIENAQCISMHSALMSESVKPQFALMSSRLGTSIMLYIPFLSFLFETASWQDLELQYFSRSLLTLPVYMTALGIVNVAVTAVMIVMVFSSQLAHRLLFRIMWRGGTGLAEKVALGLQKVPMIVSAGLICAAPLSCGAASLVAGAAFYAFMISKMYEEYLEDYVYKIMAKLASKFCRLFLSKKPLVKPDATTSLIEKPQNTQEQIRNENESSLEQNDKQIVAEDEKLKEETNLINNEEKRDADKTKDVNVKQTTNDTKSIVVVAAAEAEERESEIKTETKAKRKGRRQKSEDEQEDELNVLNFHMMLFFLWLIVTLVNIPALLTWARNFKHSMVLKPDTSYYPGMIMSVCSACLWQMNGPRKHLKYYEALSAMLFTMAVFVLAIGPISLYIVNYGVTFMFALITLQQLFDHTISPPKNIAEEIKENATEDRENSVPSEKESSQSKTEEEARFSEGSKSSNMNDSSDKDEPNTSQQNSDKSSDSAGNADCLCDESRIYNIFKNLREKFSNNDDL